MTEKIAAIQMCATDVVADNLTTALKYINEAANHGAKLVVLPETFAFMGKKQADINAHQETFGKGLMQDTMANAALNHNIWIVAGTIPITGNNKIRAACIVYDNLGKPVARYDKINLFDVEVSASEVYKESATYEPGDTPVVVNTPLGKLGLAVCFDLRFPNLFLDLANMGAEVIAVPAAFTEKTGRAHWDILTRTRAIDTYCYLVGANQGGVHVNNRKTHGHTNIVNPWGEVISEAQTCGVIYADVDLGKVLKIRKDMGQKVTALNAR